MLPNNTVIYQEICSQYYTTVPTIAIISSFASISPVIVNFTIFTPLYWKIKSLFALVVNNQPFKFVNMLLVIVKVPALLNKKPPFTLLVGNVNAVIKSFKF